jgi:hypothetical protein
MITETYKELPGAINPMANQMEMKPSDIVRVADRVVEGLDIDNVSRPLIHQGVRTLLTLVNPDKVRGNEAKTIEDLIMLLVRVRNLEVLTINDVTDSIFGELGTLELWRQDDYKIVKDFMISVVAGTNDEDFAKILDAIRNSRDKLIEEIKILDQISELTNREH